MTRMIRRWGDPDFAQSIRDVACETRLESGARVERKGAFHQTIADAFIFTHDIGDQRIAASARSPDFVLSPMR